MQSYCPSWGRHAKSVTGATLWMDLGDGQEYILVFDEALYMGDTLEHSLINPNQLQSFGIIVQDTPFANAPLGIEDLSSGITIPLIYADTRSCTHDDLSRLPHIVLSPLGIEDLSSGITIPLIYADTRSCTHDDLSRLPHIVLSSDAPWDPHGI